MSVKWQRAALQGASSEQIDQIVAEIQGLVLPYDMYTITGRFLELWSQVKSGQIDLSASIKQVLSTAALMERLLQSRYPGEYLDKLARVACDIEMSLLTLAIWARASAIRKDLPFDVPNYGQFILPALSARWFDESLSEGLRKFSNGLPPENRIRSTQNRQLYRFWRRTSDGDPPASTEDRNKHSMNKQAQS